MNKLKTKALVATAAMLFAGSVWADTFGGAGPGADLQSVMNGITVSGTSSVNAATDYLNNDGIWSITGSGQSTSVMVWESPTAAYKNTNTFGVYQGSQYVQLFSGAQSPGTSFPTASNLSFGADGSVLLNNADTGINFTADANGVIKFGFYLDSTGYPSDNTGVWHSDQSLNVDGVDHMAAYRGTGDAIQLPGSGTVGTWTPDEYLLGWEDLNCGNYCDGNYSDMVVMVESVAPSPVPAPATVGLMGLGLLGIAAVGLRRNKR